MSLNTRYYDFWYLLMGTMLGKTFCKDTEPNLKHSQHVMSNRSPIFPFTNVRLWFKDCPYVSCLQWPGTCSATSLGGKHRHVDMNLKSSVMLQNGNFFQVNNISETFFCWTICHLIFPFSD